MRQSKEKGPKTGHDFKAGRGDIFQIKQSLFIKLAFGRVFFLQVSTLQIDFKRCTIKI